jgi:hypothetical protein
MHNPSESHPLTSTAFHRDRPSEPLWDLAEARHKALSDAERATRLTQAFEALGDDDVDLDDGGEQALFEVVAHPERRWAQSPTGRRAFEELMRLEQVFDRQRDEGDWRSAWDTLEEATGFFGVAQWLCDQPTPARHGPPPTPTVVADLNWVDELLERCNHDVLLLVPHFLVHTDPTTLAHCSETATALAERINRPDQELAALAAFCSDRPVLNEHLWTIAECLATRVHADLTVAVPDRDRTRIAAAVKTGAVALEIFAAFDDAGDMWFDGSGT